MGSFRFVHASHLHLDAPMRGVGGAPAELRTALRDASLHAWDAVVDLAIERRASFLLLAGGIFAGDALGGPTARARAALLGGARKLCGAGIPILACVGPEDGESARRHAADLERAGAGTVFDSHRFAALPIVRDGIRLATVHGASSLGGDWKAPPPRALRRPGAGAQIALAPLDPISGRADSTPDATKLAGNGFDYWALGGSHQWAQVHEQPCVVQAGTPQGRGTDPVEAGPKGAVVAEVDDDRIDRIVAVELVPLDRVRFVCLHADVDLDDVAGLSVRLVRRLEAEAGGPDAGIAIADVTLGGGFDGRGAENRPTHRSTLAARLLAELRRTADGRAPVVFWNRVRDLAFQSRQLAATVPGSLARVIGERAESLANATLPRSSFLAERLEALHRVWATELDVSSAPSLVREAAARAVEMVATETSDENPKLGN